MDVVATVESLADENVQLDSEQHEQLLNLNRWDAALHAHATALAARRSAAATVRVARSARPGGWRRCL